MELEKNIEQYLVRETEKRRGVCLKHGQDGWPDRIVLLPEGVCVWVELKRKGGVLSPLQQTRLAKLHALGQKVRVVWSKADVDCLMHEMGLSAANNVCEKGE